jgi:hypothetical protein
VTVYVIRVRIGVHIESYPFDPGVVLCNEIEGGMIGGMGEARKDYMLRSQIWQKRLDGGVEQLGRVIDPCRTRE